MTPTAHNRRLRLTPLAATALAALLLAPMTGCKPNEAAYKQAYETALAKRNADDAASTAGTTEGTIYNRYRDLATQRTMALGADSLQVTTEFVSVTEGLPADSLRRYSVVAGKFKQLFNARQMAKRLDGLGYHAFIVQTREPLYYVATMTSDMAQAALEGRLTVAADSSLRLKTPMPFVLESARNRR